MGTIIAVRQRPAMSLRIVAGVSTLDVPRHATVKAVILVASDSTKKACLPVVPELVVTVYLPRSFSP
ncbi:MAG: hypothetical protein ACRDQH_01760, partial [Pseudonocardiaceae bacterium]